jgi:hypothetical protein
MKTSLVTIAAALFCAHVTYASPAVLIEEAPMTPAASAESVHEKQIVPLSQRASIHDLETQSFEDAFALRSQKRVGVGLSLMGQLGMAGAMLELNFTPENALNLGFGGGPGYSSFGLGWKYLLGGQSLTPYLSGGYSMWHSSGGGGRLQNATPSVLSSRFLSTEQKNSGQFELSFLTPTAGLQYTQLSGEALGWSGFLELTMMTKFSQGLAIAPLASLGGIYYF